MKNFKKFALVILLVGIIGAVYINYPKLNIIAGYAAKNSCSSVFLAGRTLETTNNSDTNFSPIHLASNTVDKDQQIANSSVFGILTRKAIYREGLGSVLIDDTFDTSKKPQVPHRLLTDNLTPFPYGNAEPKDSVFENINYSKLNETIDTLFTPINQTRAVIVLYKDFLIAERYAEGFTKNSKLLGWSMTKSILSTLVGILQYQGKIHVNEKAPIEAWKNNERNQITIHNLLQMNSGLEWVEDYNTISDVTKMLFFDKDMTQRQIQKPLVGKPNQTWNYSSGTSNLLSGILRNKFNTYQDYLDFWYAALIDKIGMNSMIVETDMEGTYVGSSYSWATPRDWAKFGLLYLHKGNWNGEQLFDPSWISYVSTPTPTSNGTYGAHFWLNANGEYPDVPKNLFYASGYQGQNVYVLPDQELVIVRMGLTKNANQNQFLKGILNAIN